MATDSEMRAVLNEKELAPLMTSLVGTNARELIERDLLRRQPEIALELSSVTAARDEAQANEWAARARYKVRSATGRHPLRLTLALITLSMGIGVALARFVFGWIWAETLIASWRAPFGSGWIMGIVWAAIYVALVVTAFEIDFYLRRLPRTRRLARSEEQLTDLEAVARATEGDWQRQLVAIVRDHVTEIVNASHGPLFGASLYTRVNEESSRRQRLTVSIGLSEVNNEDNHVATEVQQRLLRMLRDLSGASIGISGPRGVGKSTLLAALCGANPTINGRRALAINTSAPVEYDNRDFLLHLFSQLCRQVLRTEGQERASEDDHAALVDARRWRSAALRENMAPIGRLLAVVGFVLTSVGAGFWYIAISLGVPITTASGTGTPQTAIVPSTAKSSPAQTASPAAGAKQPAIKPSSPTATQTPARADVSVQNSDSALGYLFTSPMFALGIVILSLGVSLVAAAGPYARFVFGPMIYRSHYYRRRDLVGRAVEELRNINFQRSYTSGWSGGLKIPVGLEAGMTEGFTLAQRPESLPELVERFRNFVTEVAAEYDNVVLIGIDELDKLKSAQHAEAFLNGVKSVFGIPRCFYLVSVSEHALAAFERRGIGFRDAFDSALDDIIQVDFLDLTQSRVLLNRRILRLPDPYLQLCHMLSGGLPRDLIRHARALLDYAANAPRGSLSLRKAVAQMTARDLAGRLRATSIQMRSGKDVPGASDLLVAVAKLPTDGSLAPSIAALGNFRDHLASSTIPRDADGQTLLRIAEELAVYYETMILIRRVCSLVSTRAGWEQATTLKLADQVAGVRQALEASVALAEVRLVELRKTINEAANAIDRLVNSHLYRRRTTRTPSRP